jgi:hypothetical protein
MNVFSLSLMSLLPLDTSRVNVCIVYDHYFLWIRVLEQFLHLGRMYLACAIN